MALGCGLRGRKTGASEMKERPILMSAPMAVATIKDLKWQTRRIAKFPSWVDRVEQETDLYYCGEGIHPSGPCEHAKCSHIGGHNGEGCASTFTLKCPYGKIGDRLWVRENYRFEKFFEIWGIDDWAATVRYPADDATRKIYQCDAPENVGFWPGAAIRKYEGKLRPGIFMYRWISRITLEITDVRVQRLQDISDDDCFAEGIQQVVNDGQKDDGSARGAYKALWESINGSGSWSLNQFVWAISFRRINE